jgi:glycosyltransferase involved in cell wall biosynthesis
VFSGLQTAVVIPAFDPGPLVDGVLASLPQWVDRIILVDDGSSRPLAPNAGTIPLTVVRHAANRGVGAAIITGYRTARAEGADVAVVVGADGQMDPGDMPALLAPIAAGDADYVKGDRLSHPDCPDVMPGVRLRGNLVLTFLTRLAGGLPGLMDAQCGYTALRLAVLDRLPLDWLYPRYGFPNDVLLAASGAGLRVAQVVVRPVYRGEPSGLRPWMALWTYPVLLARGMLMRLMLRPSGLPAGERGDR